MNKGEEAGKLLFFRKDTFEKAFEMEVGTGCEIIKLANPARKRLLAGER